MLHNSAMAEDVLQETFAAVWRNADRFDPKVGVPVAWVWVIARNRAITAVLKLRHECALDDVSGFREWPDSGPSAYDQTLQDEEAVLTQACLRQLTPDAQYLIELAYFQGLTYAQVSVLTGRPLGSIKTTFRRSLHSLRRCMARELSAAGGKSIAM
jgi:RNA polymerase sigma-70 factor (ECF subfamily)